MIHISNKHNCCGCAACAQACPRKCIMMLTDEEGFLYPRIDEALCIDCAQCEKACPHLNLGDMHDIEKVASFVHIDDCVLETSSSGGMFTKLAEIVVRDGGVVFGARFDENWDVVHAYSEIIENLAAFRGSKYVQSIIGDAFRDAERFLKSGRKVLFSGTPCQVAGLKLFLRKEYENLLTVECVCHGVPSPGMWHQYLNEQTAADGRNVSDVTGINFRDKENGWQRYNVTIKYKNGQRCSSFHGVNPWTRAFINNLSLRPSCTNCPAKCYNSRADLTLGDFWGINKVKPGSDVSRGTTLAIPHTEKGKLYLDCLDTNEYDFLQVVPFNKALVISTKENPKRELFFKQTAAGFINAVARLTQEPLSLRLKTWIANIIRYKYFF